MKLSTSRTVELLLGVSYLASGAHSAVTKCSVDNCFRALFPTNDPTRLASAQSFCATYTQSVATATTGFPARFTTACGSSPSKFSSACSCGPTATASSTSTTTTTITTTTTTASTCAPTPYEVFQNGGFECGIYPWRALVTHGTTYTLTSPGNTGNFAFEVDQNAALDGVGLGEANLQQLIYITPGTQYTLSFDSFFDVGNGGFIGVKFNGQPQYTVDASDKLGPGVWNSNTIVFTATTGQYLIEFEFLFGTSNVVAKLDNINLTPGM
ncbi:hypothetical protein MMC30_007274 [Trapelia coarctata]|nr:hypothetical protein [Trapelia coarctata]